VSEPTIVQTSLDAECDIWPKYASTTGVRIGCRAKDQCPIRMTSEIYSQPSQDTSIPVVAMMMAALPAQRPCRPKRPATVAKISSNVDTFKYLHISSYSGEQKVVRTHQER
jgi:hypothetical protein